MHVVFSETINTREEFHWLLTLLVGVVAGLPHLTISKFACKRNGLKTTFSTCCHFVGYFPDTTRYGAPVTGEVW